MNNYYYVMRHGNSKANEAGLIISNPAIGVLPEWGLTDLGREQVREGVDRALNDFLLNQSVIIYTSDFARALETAKLTANLLKSPSPRVDIRLRERFFGRFDQTSDSNYAKVWFHDENKGVNTKEGVESPDHVQKRIRSLIIELEESHRDCHIILVSHGDALQIAQTWFEGKPSHIHRSLKHLETGEIRQLQ